MPERGRAPDRVSGRRTHLVGGRLAEIGGAAQRRQLGRVDPVPPGRQRQHRLAPGDEHEGLHDLTDIATDGASGIVGRSGPFGEPPDVGGETGGGGGLGEAAGGVAHDVAPRATS